MTRPTDIAIVGMACIFPGAPDLAAYWRNIVTGVDAVGDPPEEWDADAYFDPSSSSNDRVYCKRGGWLGDLARFDPLAHGVMPTSVDGGEPDQFLALEVAHRALLDAGGAGRIADRARAGVIIGRGTYINRGFTNVVQHGMIVDQTVRLLGELHPEHTSDELQALKAELKASLPPFNAEMAPGLVPNVMSGRIANRLDLMGPNYTVDAACASSLLAVDLAMQELRAGRCDLMLAGGVHASTPAPILQIFCQLGALSRSGQIRPFDRRADGTLLGEGLGFVVLKRRHDAERDGDRVYAVVRSVGIASDGRALGLLAPRVEGEELALRRAYDAAGVDPRTVELVEAHGTGTPVGDAAEIAALTAVFGPAEPCGPTIALGTVKSMISHLIPAAGMAGLIKTALALHHRVLPPTLHCESVDPALGLERSRFYLNTASRPWIHGAPGPRRAGVDSFGFGGINAHAVLEEAADGRCRSGLEPTWPTEVVVLDAGSREELRALCTQLTGGLDEAVPLAEVAARLDADPGADPPERLTVVASSVADLAAKLGRAAAALSDRQRRRLWDPGGVFWVQDPLGRDGRVALLFPGEGSQYTGMLADVAMAMPVVRHWFDLVDRAFAGHARGFPPSRAVFPPPGDPAAHERLWQMDVGPEALFAASQGLLAVLREAGLGYDAVAGHSSGEWSALVAAGALELGDDRVVRDVAALNRVYERLEADGALSRSALLTVGGPPRAVVEDVMRDAGDRLFVALDNCPHQVVLCGDPESVGTAELVLARKGAVCEKLPIERAYHTPLFAPFTEAVRGHLDALDVRAPSIDLYSCSTAALAPRDPDGVRELAAVQWSRPVRFRETIEAMHADGVRVFVEVGPRANLTAFVDDILRRRPHLAVASNTPDDGLTALNTLVAQLLVHRVALQPARLRLPAPPPGPAGRQHAGLRLATGLQPLQLTAGNSRRFARATPPAPEAPSVAAPEAVPSVPDNPRGKVVRQHLRTMERFLDVQADVMRALLPSRAVLPGAPASPAEDPGTAAPGSVATHGTAGTAARPTPLGPYIDDVIEHLPGRRLVARCRWDVDRDRCLLDHTVERGRISARDPVLTGLPVVPLTLNLELLAEVARAFAGGGRVTALTDVSAHRWTTVPSGGRALRVTAEPADTPGAVAVRADDDADGLAARLPFVRATVQVQGDHPDPPPAMPPQAPTNGAPPSTRPFYGPQGLFHGPAFQVVRSIDRMTSDGATATLSGRGPEELLGGRRGAVATDAALLDGPGQVLAHWLAQRSTQRLDVFPVQLAALHLFAPPPPCGATVKCAVLVREVTDDRLRCDVDLTDDRGRVIARFTGWEDVRTELPERLRDFLGCPSEAFLSEPCTRPSDPAGLIRRRLDDLPAVLHDYGGLWLDVLAHCVLAEGERPLWRGLADAPPVRGKWLSERIVAKEAVRDLLAGDGDPRWSDCDVVMDAHPAGRAVVTAPTLPDGAVPVVSIDRVDGAVEATAAHPRCAPDVGMATLERCATPSPPYLTCPVDPHGGMTSRSPA